MNSENAVLEQLDNSLAIKHYDLPELTTPFHYHPQLELVCMEKGKGCRIIGDNVSNFKDNDMVFISSFLPHVWKKDVDTEPNSNQFEYYVLHFSLDTLTSLANFPEFKSIRNLSKKSECGLYIYGETRNEIARLIKKAYSADSMQRFIYFLQILHTLTSSKETTPLSSSNFAHLYSTYKTDRMSKICEYIGDNFNHNVTLEQISDIACMSQTSFCRYFKKETGISFVNYLNNIRLGYAETLLTTNKYKIAEIAAMSGFQNTSYFNRLFKRKNGTSPMDYYNK